MAIATLADLYDNPKVFTGVVKIRKGMAAQLILDTKSTGGLHKWFNILARDILSRVKPSDPSAMKTKRICKTIISITDHEGQAAIIGNYAQAINTLSPVILAVTAFHLFGHSALKPDASNALKFALALPKLVTIPDFIAAFLFFGAAAFILGYSITLSGRKQELRRAD
jgi:hypothetical protein